MRPCESWGSLSSASASVIIAMTIICAPQTHRRASIPKARFGKAAQGVWRVLGAGAWESGGRSGCASLGTGLNKASLRKLSTHLRSRVRKAAQKPGRKRPPSNAIMVWAGLDQRVGPFVRLLDALREGPGGAGSCKLVPDEKTHQWKRTSALVDPAGKSNHGCLYYQTVLVWSKPGHRKQ